MNSRMIANDQLRAAALATVLTMVASPAIGQSDPPKPVLKAMPPYVETLQQQRIREVQAAMSRAQQLVIKADLKVIERGRMDPCNNRYPLFVSASPQTRVAYIDVVAGRTSLLLIGPRMDRVARAVLYTGDRSRTAIVHARHAPGSCSNGALAGRDGAVELRFDDISAGLDRVPDRRSMIDVYARDGTITAQRPECAPNCDLEVRGAPWVATILLDVYPRPGFNSLSPGVISGPGEFGSSILTFTGNNIGSTMPLLLSNVPSYPENPQDDPIRSGIEQTPTRLRVALSFPLECAITYRTIRPALRLRSAGSLRRTVSWNDTDYEEYYGRAPFSGVSLALRRTGAACGPPPPPIPLVGVNPDPPNVLNQIGGGSNNDRPEDLGGFYSQISSRRPCKNLNGIANSTGMIEGEFTFPDVRWGVRNTSQSVTLAGPIVARLMQGSIERARMTITNLQAGQAQFESYRRVDSVAPVARSDGDPMTQGLPIQCFGVTGLASGEPWNDNDLRIVIDGVPGSTALQQFDAP